MDAIFYDDNPLPIGETGDEKYLEDFQEEDFQEEVDNEDEVDNEEDFQEEDEVDNEDKEDEEDEYPSDLDNEYPDSDYYDEDYYDERSDPHWSDDDSDRDDDFYDEYEENYYEEVQVTKKQNLKQNLEVEIIDITPEIEILNQNDKEKFNQVEDKLITLSKNLTCIICLTNQVQILTIPCGHLIMCSPCSLNLSPSVSLRETSGANSNDEKCPKCRTPIYNKIIARLP